MNDPIVGVFEMTYMLYQLNSSIAQKYTSAKYSVYPSTIYCTGKVINITGDSEPLDRNVEKQLHFGAGSVILN